MIKGGLTVKKIVHRETALAKMERSSFHKLSIVLAFFLLIISSNGAPSTRSLRLMLEDPTNASQIANEGDKAEELLNSRMYIDQNNDYPGSGANNRHTPKPPAKKLK